MYPTGLGVQSHKTALTSEARITHTSDLTIKWGGGVVPIVSFRFKNLADKLTNLIHW
jgi:hypothetical protein